MTCNRMQTDGLQFSERLILLSHHFCLVSFLFSVVILLVLLGLWILHYCCAHE